MLSDFELEQKIINARIFVAKKHGFYASFLGRFKHLMTSDLALTTCATNGTTCFYDRNFISKKEITTEVLAFIQCHEMLHCILNHFYRKENRDSKLWNISCDYAVNSILKETFNFVPGGALYSKAFKNLSAEEIYDFLADKNSNLGGSLSTLDDHEFNKNENEEGNAISLAEQQKELIDEILKEQKLTLDDHEFNKNENEEGNAISLAEQQKELIDEILKEQKLAGNVPAELERILSENSNIQSVAWNDILKAELETLKKSDFTWNLPNRRFLHQGVVLPSNRLAKTLQIAIALDCSGSIDQNALTLFLQEVYNLAICFEYLELHLWCFDTEVYNYQFFNEDKVDEIFDYKLKGGGGTSFTPNWEFMKKQNIKPQQFLVFTDGYTNDWGDENYCPTIFLISSKVKAPFGLSIDLQNSN